MSDPVIGAAIISALGSVIGGAASGAGKAKEQEKAYEIWQKKRDEKISDVNKYLKPELGRVNVEQGLASFSDALDRLTMGRMGENMGKDRSSAMGLNFADILAGLGTAKRDENSYDSASPWSGRTPPDWFGGETIYGGPGGVPAANGAWAPASGQAAGAPGASAPRLSGNGGNRTYIDEILRKYGIGA